MLWKKKKMVDLAELHRQGRIIIPKQDVVIETDKRGFVDISKKEDIIPPMPERQTNNFMSFMDSSPKQSTPDSSDDLKKISQQLSTLDNQLYKLEQRMELIERKLSIDQNNSQQLGQAGW